jgi:hypothetical protein
MALSAMNARTRNDKLRDMIRRISRRPALIYMGSIKVFLQ